MRNVNVWTGALALMVGLGIGTAPAQAQTPFPVGNPLGLPIEPAPDGSFAAISPNVKVFGAIYSAESCSYDPVRDVIVVPSRGVGQDVQENDAWIAFINHDGSIHTSRWIGQRPALRGRPRRRHRGGRPVGGRGPLVRHDDGPSRWRDAGGGVDRLQRSRGD
jgi:hypothetical protein